MVQKLLYTIKEAAEILLGEDNLANRRVVRKLGTQGDIEVKQVGRKFFVPANEIQKFKQLQVSSQAS
jgi:hypothetical protein|tara:strand:+ start:54 stop:254 length:201 start_codon:yes stop_codon:yes gene_type:complete